VVVSDTQNYLGKICPEVKLQAVELYLNGMGIRSIGHFLGVSQTTVSRWISRHAEKVKSEFQIDTIKKRTRVIELDEMWAYIKKTAKMLDMTGC